MAHVVIKDLLKIYPASGKTPAFTAVKGINLEIREGEFMVLVGPSGCGKSTTLRMVAGLEEISGGTIEIGGKVMNHVLPKDRDIAMVFQNYALYPHMTVAQNMGFGLKLRKMPAREINARVTEAAVMLGLEGLLDRLPKALSGGQRQRVAVGRAIVRKPKVFLFDEPLSNLDAKMRVSMRTEIAKLHARLGVTMIYVTHDQVEAMTMGDRICVMKEGEIMQLDQPLNLYDHPANLYTAGFIGSPPMNLFSGTIRAGGSSTAFIEANNSAPPLTIELPKSLARAAQPYHSRSVILGIRPENLRLAEAATPGMTTRVKVELSETMGAETFLHLTTAATGFIARVQPTSRYTVGDQIEIEFNPGKLHLFDASSEQAILPDQTRNP